MAAASASRPATSSSILDLLAALDALDQSKISRGEQTEVVGVLPVDALEALCDHQADAGGFFRHDAVLARRALAVALAGHDHLEAGIADGVFPIGSSEPALKPTYGNRPSASSKCTMTGNGVISSVDMSSRIGNASA
jgi:hypothetical protein